MATAATTAKVAGYASVQISLDWSGPGHYDGRWQRACRCCEGLTNLRDESGDAAHKTCVEGEIEAKVLAYAQSLLLAYAQSVQPTRRRELAKVG